MDAAASVTGGRKYVERRALEMVVKQVSRPKLLYLATHGFSHPNPELVYEGNVTFFKLATASHQPGLDHALPYSPLARSLRPVENPLLRCGLALAGANRRALARDRLDVDDGILTGMEVTMLNLTGTNLVVLSACQTGVGDLQLGEGGMGLRRTFAMAGARRVLSSLWMVPDLQTQQLMTDFITRWGGGGSAVDAFRNAANLHNRTDSQSPRPCPSILLGCIHYDGRLAIKSAE